MFEKKKKEPKPRERISTPLADSLRQAFEIGCWEVQDGVRHARRAPEIARQVSLVMNGPHALGDSDAAFVMYLAGRRAGERA